MVTNPLKKYYEDNLSKGYTIEQISENLRNSSYADDTIKQAVSSLDQQSKDLSVQNSLKFKQPTQSSKPFAANTSGSIANNANNGKPQTPLQLSQANQNPLGSKALTSQPSQNSTSKIEKHPGLDSNSSLKYIGIIAGIILVIGISVFIFMISDDLGFSSGGSMDRYIDAVGIDDDLDFKDSSSELEEDHDDELQDGCIKFPDNLRECSPFECFFTHPLTGTEMKREIKFMEDSYCMYEEEMPGGSYMSCRFPSDSLEKISDYYRLLLNAEEYSEEIELSLTDGTGTYSDSDISEINILDFCDYIFPEEDEPDVPDEVPIEQPQEKTCLVNETCFDGDILTLNYCEDGICKVMIRDDGRPCVSGDGYCPPRCYGFEFNDTDCLDNSGRMLCEEDSHCDNFDNMTEDVCHRNGYCIHIEITIPNNPPIINSTPKLEAISLEKYTYQVVAIDEDGDQLFYSLSSNAPNNMTINNKTGLLEWYPVDSDYSSGNFSVIVSDGKDQVRQYILIMVYIDEDDDPIRNQCGSSDTCYFQVILEEEEYKMCKYLERYWEVPIRSTYSCLFRLSQEINSSQPCNYIYNSGLNTCCKENYKKSNSEFKFEDC